MKILSLLLALTQPAQSDDTSWHFLAQSYGGTISLVKGLSRAECDFMVCRAYHLACTDEEMAAQARLDAERAKAASTCNPEKTICLGSAVTQGYAITAGDIRVAECFQ